MARLYGGEVSRGYEGSTLSIYSESLPELSSSLLESLSCPLAAAGVGIGGSVVLVVPVAACSSNKRICASSFLIFASSTSSSMLLRLRPPVPVPLPVRGFFGGGGFIGRMTKL